MAKFRAGKKRRRFKIKYLLFILIVYISYSATFYFLSHKYINIDNEQFLKYMLSESNHNLIYRYSKTNFINKALSYFTDIDITNPVSILDTAFVINKEPPSDEDENNLEELKKISQYIEDPFESEVSSPVVYLYNTHQLENYSSKNLEAYNITPNVMMASYILRENLNNLGIKTIVEEGDVTALLAEKGWKYVRSYRITRSLMEKKILEEPTLEYFIDVHRDSVARKYTTYEENGVSYAKILFVVGLENKNYAPNLELAKKISSMINSKKNGLSKGILTREGPTVNGVYNQDFSPNTMLMEIGGVDNTIEEVNNTLEIVAQVLSEYIKEKKNG